MFETRYIENPIKEAWTAARIRHFIRNEMKRLNPKEMVAVLRETRDLTMKDLKRAKEEVAELEEVLDT